MVLITLVLCRSPHRFHVSDASASLDPFQGRSD